MSFSGKLYDFQQHVLLLPVFVRGPQKRREIHLLHTKLSCGRIVCLFSSQNLFLGSLYDDKKAY